MAPRSGVVKWSWPPEHVCELVQTVTYLFVYTIEVATLNWFRLYSVSCSLRLKLQVNHSIKKPYFSRFLTDFCVLVLNVPLVRTARRTVKTAENTHTSLLFELKVCIWFKNHVVFSKPKLYCFPTLYFCFDLVM